MKEGAFPTYKDQVNVSGGAVDPSFLPNEAPIVEAEAISATQLIRENRLRPSLRSIDLNDDVPETKTGSDVFTVKRATLCWTMVVILPILLTAGGVVGGFCGTGRCSSSSANSSVEGIGDTATVSSGNLRSNAPSTGSSITVPASPSESPVESLLSTNVPTTPTASATAAPVSATLARATRITTLVNQQRLSEVQLEYPAPTNEAPSPEQQALVHIIEFSTWLEDESELMERYALMSLWYANGGAGWSRGNQWNSQVTVCQWPSVECNSDGRLSGLLLWSNGLRGALTPEIGLLTSLTTLGLGDNNLSGTIPESLSSCTLLERLAFDRNKIGGTIPTELSKLTALTSLNMAVNILMGSLPSSLSTLTKLKEFHLDNNAAIIGNVPSELASWTSLNKAYFFNTNLQGSMPLCWECAKQQFKDSQGKCIGKSVV